ncbi:histone-lysine N-methyltransferase SETMAR [Trichonephila clavipes]|uniref:Histone-lysine N-methyltransferase SETMAR n=1 Tax=Trichonephila clavipes TaxID=2585209 RepID=A0A8X6SDH6_TRICX|nr:histone-lysine N-methyltransferase SETMAR [Trichonephila clavipes]
MLTGFDERERESPDWGGWNVARRRSYRKSFDIFQVGGENPDAGGESLLSLVESTWPFDIWLWIVVIEILNSDIIESVKIIEKGNCQVLNDGRKNVHDEPRSGRPSVITDDLVNALDEKIREDRRFTISTLALEFPNVGRTTLHKVVSEKLKFRKLCARCVPRLLSKEHKLKRMACALDFLDRYHKEGDQFLERIVTGDETWVSHITPESKRQSMEWRHTSQSKGQADNLNTQDLLDGNRLTTGSPVDKVSNHGRHTVQTGLRVIFTYVPWFYLKEFLGGKRFDRAGKVKEEVQDWLSSPAADVYDLGIQMR